MTPTTVTVNGDRVAYRTSGGTGPAALLIHGNSASSRAFAHQLEGPLGATHRLVAIDLPGHGESDDASDPAAVYSIPGFAAVVAAVAETLDLTEAVLVGWSLGGHIALEALAALPDTRGVMVFGAPPLAYPPDMGAAFLPDPAMAILFQEHYTEDEIAMRVAGMFAPGAEIPDFYADDVRRSDGRFRRLFFESVGTVGFADEVDIVANMTVPLAVIHGSAERVISGPYIEGLDMPTLWRGSLQVVDGVGHSPFWEDPEAFDNLLGAFITETAS